MPSSFQRVNHSLRLDRGLPAIAAIAIALVLLAAWLVWAFAARVTQYEVSDVARLEVAGAAYPLQANATGRLIASQLILGRNVKAGDVLVELDRNEQELGLAQERAHFAALEPELAALRLQMRSEDEARAAERTVLTFSTGSAQAQYQQAQAQQALAEQEAHRAARLRADGLISQADAERVSADAAGKRALAESMRVGVARLQPELQVRDRERDVRLKQLLGDITKLEAEAAASTANRQRLEYELLKRSIRAPIAGTLSECAQVHAGAHIAEGQQLGIIIPDNRLRLIAEFEPAAAFGKIRPGQNAIVRLQGFPWAQFGTVRAQVSEVAGEIRDGKVRVELAVDTASRGRIPFQHGMPGTVEVAVDRTSPALLLLRSAGRVAGAH
jgi:membrane fusion protein (multidrug efflux system)